MEAKIITGLDRLHSGGTPSAQQLERRKEGRFVPMKVLVLGLGRTGTSSIRAALKQLGFNHTYHMASIVLENQADADVWVEAMERKFEGKGPPFTAEEWDRVLGHCMAVTDWPCAAFPDELIAAYPNAKVILSVRDSAEVWQKSVMESLYRLRPITCPPTTLWQRLIQSVFYFPGKPLIAKLFQHHILTEDFPEKGAQAYLDHNAHVRAITPKGNFLEFNVKQGWGPFCEFIGVPVPDTPFPRVNDGATFQTVLADILKASRVALLKKSLPWVLGAATAVAAVAVAWPNRNSVEQALGRLY